MNERILDALRGTLLTRRSLEGLPGEVWKRVGALNTWGTNAIEGNTLTRDEVDALLLEERNVPNRPLRDVLETAQHERAFQSLLQRKDKPTTLVTALELHGAVFEGSRTADPGHWRRVNVRITGSEHRPPRAERVVGEMDAWRLEYDKRALAGEDPFTLGAWSHERFEGVHPFADGNGRVGRLLLNLHFMRHGWPPLHVGPPQRSAYIKALEAGHKGNLQPLEGLLRMLMASSLLDVLDQVGTEQDELRPLSNLASKAGYGAHYLALRAVQGELPAVKGRGRWQTSGRAVSLYKQHVARG